MMIRLLLFMMLSAPALASAQNHVGHDEDDKVGRGHHKIGVVVDALSALDFNDGGSRMIIQHQGLVAKQKDDAYVAKFYIEVNPEKHNWRILEVQVIEPETPFPYELHVATNFLQDDPQNACQVSSSFQVCVPPEASAQTYGGYLYVYGDITVGDLPARQYASDIVVEATYTEIPCLAFDPCQ